VSVADKLCTKCNRKLSRDQFYKQAARKDGLMSSCKSCESKRTTAGGLIESRHNKTVYAATLSEMKKRLGYE
jgi:NAD-dependent SIR2 family protein deacetylase